MSHRHHLLEKIQVELAAAVAAAVVYFWAAPALPLNDPQWPIVFLPTGNFGAAASAALVIWGLTVLCVLATVSARAEGSMLAALIGAAGYSMYSPQIRGLLWYRQANLPSLYGVLISEVLLLSLVLVGVAILVTLVRRTVSAACPRCAWRSPLLRQDQAPTNWLERLFGPGYHIRGLAGQSLTTLGGRIRQSAMFLVTGMLLSMVLLVLLMRSADRGQIVFALLASFTLGVLIAHQLLPVPNSILSWAMPVPVAILFYLLAMFTSSDTSSQAWMSVHHYGRALPIDWVTVASGGALLGFWISERLHEVRHFETSQESGE